MPEGPEPLGVWDASTFRFAGPDLARQVDQWVEAHLDPPHDLWRIEFYADPPRALVGRFRRNETGHKYVDPVTGEAALARPELVLLDELPPEHLRR